MNTVDGAPIIGCEKAKNIKIISKTHNITISNDQIHCSKKELGPTIYHEHIETWPHAYNG